MKVLFLNPPFLPRFSREQRSPAVTKSGTLYYPIWLATAAGVTEDAGFDVDLVDAPARGYDRDFVYGLARKGGYDLVVLDTSTPSIYNDVEVGARIKELLPSSFVVLVGPHVSALPGESLELEPAIDAVARREYDHTILELARTLSGGRDLSAVNGLSFRRDGNIVHNPARPFLGDLDSLPFVSKVYKRHLNYRDYFYSHSPYPILTIATSRGCPFKCTFCLYPNTFSGHNYRTRSPGNVVEEIAYINREFPGVKTIMFEDETLTLDEKRVQRICDLMVERGQARNWSGNSRIDISWETLVKMKRSGCGLLCAGFESLDQRVIDGIKKRTDVETMRRFLINTKKLGIHVNACFMVGNKGETLEGIRKTVDFIKKYNPYTAQFIPMMVYPGTPDYEWARSNKYLDTEDFRQWCTEEGLFNSTISRPGLSAADLTAFCNYAKKRYYLRPSYLWMKVRETLRHPGEIRRNFRATRLFLKNLVKGY